MTIPLLSVLICVAPAWSEVEHRASGGTLDRSDDQLRQGAARDRRWEVWLPSPSVGRLEIYSYKAVVELNCVLQRTSKTAFRTSFRLLELNLMREFFRYTALFFFGAASFGILLFVFKYPRTSEVRVWGIRLCHASGLLGVLMHWLWIGALTELSILISAALLVSIVGFEISTHFLR